MTSKRIRKPRKYKQEYIVHAFGIGGLVILVLLKLAVSRWGAKPRLKDPELVVAFQTSAPVPANTSAPSVAPSAAASTAASTAASEASPSAPPSVPAAARPSDSAAARPQAPPSPPAPGPAPKAAPEPPSSLDKSTWDSYGDGSGAFARVELNTADTTELMKLYGIGSYFAKQIIKRRDALGGYMRPEQLLEVRGIDAARLEGFYKQVYIDTTYVTRYSLKTVTIDQLAAHPYIGRYLAQSILRYRDVVGVEACTLETLVQEKILTSEQGNKIGLYLITE